MGEQVIFDEETVVPKALYNDPTAAVSAPGREVEGDKRDKSAVRRRGQAFARYGLEKKPTRVVTAEPVELPDLFDDDEDEVTLVREGAYRPAVTAKPHPVRAPIPEPPALPIELVRKSGDWIEELHPAARKVLEESSRLRPKWPMSPRIDHTIADPVPQFDV